MTAVSTPDTAASSQSAPAPYSAAWWPRTARTTSRSTTIALTTASSTKSMILATARSNSPAGVSVPAARVPGVWSIIAAPSLVARRALVPSLGTRRGSAHHQALDVVLLGDGHQLLD